MKILALTLSTVLAISPMAWAGSAAAGLVQNLRSQCDPAETASAKRTVRDIVKHPGTQTTTSAPLTGATLSPWWGLNLAPLNPDLAGYFGTQKGALVLSTDNRRYPGLKAGDVIMDVNGTSVATPMDVMRTLRGIAAGSSVTWKVLRHRHTQNVTMKAPPTIWHISPMKLPFPGKPHATKVITYTYTQNIATP